ncbi:helix-turn-helix domain-containing protein [Solibacillus isronensis]|uniref:helix-turn-helix domain-containing protein n=1 Tax=Solibacillus isronensis TaxID=412383 RepID=UPI0039A3F011
MTNFQFAAIFAERRKQLQLTQEEIARHVGVSRAAVSKWEKGQSYPDIALLPKLATFFNISIDALLGYEPQLTDERILKMYAELAQRFSKEPFAEVDTAIDQLIEEYYSCFPFLLKMAQLYVNYFNLAQEKEVVADKIQNLCKRVKEFSGDYRLNNEANLLEAYTYILKGEPQHVLELLGENAVVQLGTEQLIATAQTMLGNIEKAKEIHQVNMYQHLLYMITNANEALGLEMGNIPYFEQSVSRIETIIETFHLDKLNIHNTLLFYLKAASGYAIQNNIDEAIRCIERYVRICTQIKYPLQLTGDDYFYLLDGWIAKEVMLSTQTPRDEESIKKSIYESIADNPALASVQNDKRYKSLLVNLKHHLKI